MLRASHLNTTKKNPGTDIPSPGLVTSSRREALLPATVGWRLSIPAVAIFCILAAAALLTGCQHLDGPTIHLGSPEDPRLNPQTQF